MKNLGQRVPKEWGGVGGSQSSGDRWAAQNSADLYINTKFFRCSFYLSLVRIMTHQDKTTESEIPTVKNRVNFLFLSITTQNVQPPFIDVPPEAQAGQPCLC